MFEPSIYWDTCRLEANKLLERVQIKECFPDGWNLKEVSRYIESLIMRLPTTGFWLDGSMGGDKNWLILDGAKRIYIIKAYLEGEFPLEGATLMPQIDQKFYHELEPMYRRRLWERETISHVIRPGSKPEAVEILMENLKVRF